MTTPEQPSGPEFAVPTLLHHELAANNLTTEIQTQGLLFVANQELTRIAIAQSKSGALTSKGFVELAQLEELTDFHTGRLVGHRLLRDTYVACGVELPTLPDQIACYYAKLDQDHLGVMLLHGQLDDPEQLASNLITSLQPTMVENLEFCAPTNEDSDKLAFLHGMADMLLLANAAAELRYGIGEGNKEQNLAVKCDIAAVAEAVESLCSRAQSDDDQMSRVGLAGGSFSLGEWKVHVSRMPVTELAQAPDYQVGIQPPSKYLTETPTGLRVDYTVCHEPELVVRGVGANYIEESGSSPRIILPSEVDYMYATAAMPLGGFAGQGDKARPHEIRLLRKILQRAAANPTAI